MDLTVPSFQSPTMRFHSTSKTFISQTLDSDSVTGKTRKQQDEVQITTETNLT